jgi:hypothetical protein
MKTILLSYLIVCMAIMSPVSLLAEVDSSTDTPNDEKQKVKHFMYFRGRPLPECRTFWITEFAYLYRINPRENVAIYDLGNGRGTMNFGLMMNIDRHWAIGGSFYHSVCYDNNRTGFTIRLRRWLPIHEDGRSPLRIDLSTGPILRISHKEIYRDMPGIMANLSLDFEDWFALTGQVDLLHIIDSESEHSRTKPFTDVQWYFGFRSGSYGSIIVGTVIVGLLFLISLALRNMQWPSD